MRPRKQRKIGCHPARHVFKPRGVPVRELSTVELTLEELEALRLADQLGLHHEEAGRRMEISRATFGRLLESARKKTATALVEGRAILIEKPTGRKPASSSGSHRQEKEVQERE